MKPRIAAICAIVAFATCGGRAPAQFPDCAHISTEAQGECEAGNFEVYIVNDRTDGQVEVTIHVELLDLVPGNITSTDQVLTLEAGERRKLGCLIFAPQTRYTWALVGCQPL
jgi:predicted small lipoprotein YifL